MRLNYLAIIGLILFGYIIITVGVEQILYALETFNPVYLLPLFFVVALNLALRALKWKVVIRSYGFDYPFMDACKAFLVGLFVGLITPGRVGDFIRVFYLKGGRISLGSSLSTVVVDRILDMVTLAIFSLTALAWLSIYFGAPISFIAIMGIFFIPISVYFILHQGIIKKVMRPVFQATVPERYKQPLRMDFEDFYSSMYAAKARGIGVAFVLAIGGWLLTSLEGYLIALSLGIVLPYYYFVFFIPLLTLVELLPISVSGLGTREAAAIVLFSTIGFSADKAVAFSLLYLVLGYWLAALVGAGIWFRSPMRIKIK